MTDRSHDRCGYAWPEDHEVGDFPSQQSCCYRETLPDADRCVWHADPSETDGKTADRLLADHARSDDRDRAGDRDRTASLIELLDGANLSTLSLDAGLSLDRTALRDAVCSGLSAPETELSGADLSRAMLSGASLSDADGSDATLRDADLSDAGLPGADISDADAAGADLSNANLSGAVLAGAFCARSDLSGANLLRADCSGATFRDADLSDISLLEGDCSDAHLSDAVLSGGNFAGVDLSDASLFDVEAIDAEFPGADLSGAQLRGADFSGATLNGADLTDADLRSVDLSDADLRDADLSDADLRGAKLSDANLSGATIVGTDLEQAVLVRTNLFDADLTDCAPHGATFTDVRINDGTELRSPDRRNENDRRWRTGLGSLPPRCVYDPSRSNGEGDDETTLDQLGKAADTYQTFERLARENARPSLQSQMFVLRQDMQRKRHRLNGDYFEWGFARLSRALFKHGESLGRIVAWAIAIVVGYAAVYTRFDLVVDAGGSYVGNPVDALYFSTLTFTTLGLGDFQPDAASEIARILVTSQAALGAILLAIFVFVLGRRAAK